MTTHFTSGVTNVGAGSTLGRAKMPVPAKYHTYHNDFDTYLASDWTITTTEGGSGNASEALGDGDGGLLVITNDDADNDNDFLQLTKEGFKYEAGKQLAFNARFKTSDADASDVVNAIRNTGVLPQGYTVNHYLTDPDAYFILTSVTEAGEGLKMFQRTAMETSMEPDFATDNIRYKARERYSFGFSDWRGIYGSQGA